MRPRPRPTLIAQTAPPPVRQPTDFTAPVQVEPTPQPAHAEAHIETHVGPAPQPEYSAQLEASEDGFDDGVSVDMDAVEDMDMDIDVDVPAAPQAEQRTPPHTPATQDSSAARPQADPALAADLEPSGPAQDPAKPKKSVLGGVVKVFLLLLLLLVGGLMTWSLIVNQDPDPRRLLQEQFGIDLGVPVPAPAQPADGAAADDKADADGGKDDDNG
ncbi:hypothetical protein DB30_04088 [Enhygromyxa salina]|uniref:Uncharacterized protein n=1 Tax=Enhygromyxa salina TaxID=215803 RepID=A0A0C2D119_9BACT|nr:hypothetical protein DB30_04088 [Enhygromyxa salina]